MSTFNLRARFARRLPDPLFKSSERHLLLCPVEEIPRNLPIDQSNVRTQNVQRKVYKEVAKHLLNDNDEGTKNTFHLKNKGITILAEQVVRHADDETFEIVFSSDSQGIVDGGHTYKIICDNQDEIRERNEQTQSDETLTENEREEQVIRQFVKVEVLTSLTTDLTTEIARGLNTAVQVQEQTLANHAGKFEWIKKEIEGEPYEEDIAFRENVSAAYDVMDVLAILELFNIFDYPNDGSSKTPTRAYTSQFNVLASFLKQEKSETSVASLERLRPIMKDILRLHDIVSSQARDKWNAGSSKKSKRSGGHLAFIHGKEDAHKKGRRTRTESQQFDFPFIGTKGKFRLYKGALFPILGAFRWMVVVDEHTGNARWRGSFEDVLAIWDKLALKLLEATRETSDELGRNTDAIGKSSNHWKNLYNVVAFHQAVTLSK